MVHIPSMIRATNTYIIAGQLRGVGELYPDFLETIPNKGLIDKVKK